MRMIYEGMNESIYVYPNFSDVGTCLTFYVHTQVFFFFLLRMTLMHMCVFHQLNSYYIVRKRLR